MPLKCIYRWLGPLYYDFMGFDMGFLALFSFSATLPQLKQMKDMALSKGAMALCPFKGLAAHWLADLEPECFVCLCN